MNQNNIENELERYSISSKLMEYLSQHVPTKATNILFQLFNGFQAMFQNLEYRLNIVKRESNLLTAQYLSSLRHLASVNGFEPSLKQSAKGLLVVKIQPKLFNRVGFPIYIKPNAIFTNSVTKLQYVYTSDAIIKITESETFVPVIEGIIHEEQRTIETDRYINRLYLNTENICDDSIMIISNGYHFKEVKSFVDTQDLNDNKLFIVKHSNNSQQPIVLYLKGLKHGDTVIIRYLISNGEIGNISKRAKFSTESLLDVYGGVINYGHDEVEIQSVTGFSLGSNGSDENTLRAAIGFNHGINLLFDNLSYRNFIQRYSTIGLQDIRIQRDFKQINHIYIWNRVSMLNRANIVNEYRQAIHNQLYLVSQQNLETLDKLIEENEYCLSSHVLHQALTKKYAFQFKFKTKEELVSNKVQLEQLVYEAFSNFLHNRYYSINLNQIFADYQKLNNVSFQWLLLVEDEEVVPNQTEIIIKHELGSDPINKHYQSNSVQAKLPILSGDFKIKTTDGSLQTVQNEINWVVNN